MSPDRELADGKQSQQVGTRQMGIIEALYRKKENEGEKSEKEREMKCKCV